MEIKEKKSVLILMFLGIALIASGITLVAFNSPYNNPAVMGHSGDEIRVDVSGSEKNLNTALSDLDSYLTSIETNAVNQLTSCESDLSATESDLSDCNSDLGTCESDLSDCEASACSFCECGWSGWSIEFPTGGYPYTKAINNMNDMEYCYGGENGGYIRISKRCNDGCIVEQEIVCTRVYQSGPAK